MNLKELIVFTYGIVMGTSTPYLKPRKRYLFPTSVHERDGIVFFLGGSGVCAAVRGVGETLIVNTNQRAAAAEWHALLERRGWLDRYSIILNSNDPDFAGGLELFPKAVQVWRPESVLTETTVTCAGESIRLMPLGACGTAADLAALIERASVLFLGAAFYNAIHPSLTPESTARVAHWISQLKQMVSTVKARIFVPGEGDLGSAENVERFIAYLKALSDPAVEFSECRRDFDWIEIPSQSSLEQNFDLLRKNSKTHTTL